MSELIRESLSRLFNPPPRDPAILARQQADRVIRAANELSHPDVLAGLVRNVKGPRPSRPARPKAK